MDEKDNNSKKSNKASPTDFDEIQPNNSKKQHPIGKTMQGL
jgi:hypothetical protein